MEIVFLCIVVFLCILAIFDLVVGVSNDAVNFINSAIGAKVAPFRVIIAVAAVGVFAGASVSNGMMDVARHGIFTPEYFTFYEVMCIFLAVMVTDVVLLDVFNSLGMPTSTTVSLVFEMLGGAFALAVVKMAAGEVDASGVPLGIGSLLNTDKALSVIMAIFASVAVAFVFGVIVMWLSRVVFSFVQPDNRSVKTIVFGALSGTAIVWFLLINGLKSSSFMTAGLKDYIGSHSMMILSVCFLAMVLVMSLLAILRVNVLKVVVLTGTFALAMAFAGNDLVNFVGVPLTGLDAYHDYSVNGMGNPDGYMMTSLMESAKTPPLYLMAAGLIMVLALVFSKKAQNVVKTSVDLSRQDEGDEMFGSSAVARTLVRTSTHTFAFFVRFLPGRFVAFVDRRFSKEDMQLPEGAAFDMVRASINLVLAGLLVAIGTSYKLPLSTTYVTFMVAMGASLADRAWSRESAVFRITGVISVIGGWFVTAGVAFFICFAVTNAMYFGSYPIMVLAIAIVIFLIVNSNVRYAKKAISAEDRLFQQILRSHDKGEIWQLLCEHIRKGNAGRLRFVIEKYRSTTDAFLTDNYKMLRHGASQIDEEKNDLKRQRRRELIAMQRLDPVTVIQRNTWYYLGIDSCQQMLYCLRRIYDPIREHISNNFSPLTNGKAMEFVALRNDVIELYTRTLQMLESGDFTDADSIRNECNLLQRKFSSARKQNLDILQDSRVNLNTQLLTINILQESQELIGDLKHTIRGMNKFAGTGD